MTKKINYTPRSPEAQARINDARARAIAVPHTVEGIVYPCIAAAVKGSGLTEYTIRKRINDDVEGYSKGHRNGGVFKMKKGCRTLTLEEYREIVRARKDSSPQKV